MSQRAENPGKTKIYTIGHSNIELEKFVELLQFYSIKIVADVRSEPVSRYAHWFNKNRLEKSLNEEGISYVFLGKSLGGRPEDPEVYEENGELDYEALRHREYFIEGIEKLLETSSENRAAVMCSEENPLNCHRKLLITPALEARGAEILHIRHDGSLMKDYELTPQMKLPLD